MVTSNNLTLLTTASQGYTNSDWSEKEFRQRNEKKVELNNLNFFSREIFLAKSYQKVTAHVCDVFRSNFSAFRPVFSHWRLALSGIVSTWTVT